MNSRTDILTLADVTNLVNTFYDKVRQNDLLGPVFNDRIADNWPEHLEKMYRFWQTILLEEHTYFSRPFPPHATMPIDGRHFQQWMTLFTQTVDELFEGDKAEEAKWRAGKMAALFQSKIEYIKTNGFKAVL